MKEYQSQELSRIVEEMERVQKEHPKATVLFDTENYRINITYPLPEDLIKIKSIKYPPNHIYKL